MQMRQVIWILTLDVQLLNADWFTRKVSLPDLSQPSCLRESTITVCENTENVTKTFNKRNNILFTSFF